ncbi:MAG: caspase family protein [Pseudomonadota bacterium]
MGVGLHISGLSKWLWRAVILLSIGVLQLGIASAGERLECGSDNEDARVALIIANGRYPDFNWPQLANATNDGKQVCKALAGTGFRVTLLLNASSTDIRENLGVFGRQAAIAETALVYYAGHGFEYGGNNYIVPVDAPAVASKAELSSAFIPLQQVMDAASNASTFSLFFMDACRTEDAVVQLRDVEPAGPDGGVHPVGLLRLDRGVVFYSTAKGRPAFDDAPAGSRVSPFAKAIIQRIDTPGLELSYFFKAVGRDVYALTKDMQPDAQYPFPYGIFYDDFYFVEASREQRPNPVGSALGGIIGGSRPRQIDPVLLAWLSELTIDRLAVTDEPVIIDELLARFKAEEVINAAMSGNMLAQYLLGYMYHFGVGVPKDLSRARTMLRQAAQKGHPAAQLEYGYFLITNKSSDADIDTALQMYHASAEQGYAKAQSHLASLYWLGKYGLNDKPRALALFRSAADKGHPFAIYALGTYGDDFTGSETRLRQLAGDGNLEGHHWICSLYDHYYRASEAAEDCVKAARAGFADSRAITASLYAEGRGVAKSGEEALFWAELALGQPDLQPGRKAKMLSLKAGYSGE